MFEDPGTYVIPYLPSRVKTEANDWRKKGRAVFQRIISTREDVLCRNCGDVRYIYLSFCKAGPFQSAPSTKAVVTWFDGDNINGKGFYIVENTVAYSCPHCEQGIPNGVSDE